MRLLLCRFHSISLPSLCQWNYGSVASLLVQWFQIPWRGRILCHLHCSMRLYGRGLVARGSGLSLEKTIDVTHRFPCSTSSAMIQYDTALDEYMLYIMSLIARFGDPQDLINWCPSLLSDGACLNLGIGGILLSLIIICFLFVLRNNSRLQGFVALSANRVDPDLAPPSREVYLVRVPIV